MPKQIQTHLADFYGYPVELTQYDNKHWISAEALGNALCLKKAGTKVKQMVNRHMTELEDELDATESNLLLSLYAAQLVTLWFDSAKTVSLRTWLKQRERATQLPVDLLPPAEPKPLLDEIELLNTLTECLNESDGHLSPLRDYIARQNKKATERLRLVLLVRDRINAKCKEMIS